MPWNPGLILEGVDPVPIKEEKHEYSQTIGDDYARAYEAHREAQDFYRKWKHLPISFNTELDCHFWCNVADDMRERYARIHTEEMAAALQTMYEQMSDMWERKKYALLSERKG